MSTRSRRRFTPEFKAEAVELVEAAGGNIAQVAKELGIYDSTLGNWLRQDREQAAGAPSAEERAEIRELKRELERTRRERDILAKAVAFFSGSPGSRPGHQSSPAQTGERRQSISARRAGTTIEAKVLGNADRGGRRPTVVVTADGDHRP
jgi:transposase